MKQKRFLEGFFFFLENVHKCTPPPPPLIPTNVRKDLSLRLKSDGCSQKKTLLGEFWGAEWLWGPRALFYLIKRDVLPAPSQATPKRGCQFTCPSQFSSVAQSCPTLCDPMNRSMTGLPVHHHLPEFTQTHIHRVRDAIQPSHPLSSPSPPVPDLRSLPQHHSSKASIFQRSAFFTVQLSYPYMTTGKTIRITQNGHKKILKRKEKWKMKIYIACIIQGSTLGLSWQIIKVRFRASLVPV